MLYVKPLIVWDFGVSFQIHIIFYDDGNIMQCKYHVVVGCSQTHSIIIT